MTRPLADIRREVRECGEDGCTLEPRNDIRQLLGLMDELAEVLEKWSRESRLQTFYDRERFRGEALRLLAKVYGTEQERA